MTTLTREWLKSQISSIEAVGITDSNTLQAFKIALAAMQQEPVTEVLSNRPGNDTSTIDRALPVGTQLHTTPPVPVVPDEMPCGGAENEYHDGYQDGWNACRAALLQGKSEDVSNRDELNSPVIGEDRIDEAI